LIPAEQVESIEIMSGKYLIWFRCSSRSYQYHSKKAGKKAIAGTAYMNIGTQTTADGTNYRPEDYNQGLSVNGNLDKFNYYAL
jgi:vitamin B12 transporter